MSDLQFGESINTISLLNPHLNSGESVFCVAAAVCGVVVIGSTDCLHLVFNGDYLIDDLSLKFREKPKK